jgi:hypothetical protein
MTNKFWTIFDIVILVVVWLVPGWLIAYVMDGLTHGGLPTKVWIQVILEWPLWLIHLVIGGLG